MSAARLLQALLAAAVLLTTGAATAGDATKLLKSHGNPTGARYKAQVYARNPWSVRAFGGKLYVASGNSNNKGPSPNAGPVDLFTLDPASGKLTADYVVPEEQVDVMKVIDGALWIPGHDAHLTGRKTSKVEKALSVLPDWEYGSVYHRRAQGWEQLRHIKNGIHVYDLLQFDGKLFAAVSTVTGGTVARSTDGGHSWHEMFTYVKPGERTRTLFVLGGKLYASTSGGRAYRWDGKKDMAHLASVKLFPGLSETGGLHAARPTSFKGQVAYIAAQTLFDHDWAPKGLYAAASIDAPRAVALPGGAMPRDLLVNGDTLLVLAATGSKTHVFATKDLKTFEERVWFDAGTFARSFDVLDGALYFGLGCDPSSLHARTGEVVSLAKGAW